MHKPMRDDGGRRNERRPRCADEQERGELEYKHRRHDCGVRSARVTFCVGRDQDGGQRQSGEFKTSERLGPAHPPKQQAGASCQERKNDHARVARRHDRFVQQGEDQREVGRESRSPDNRESWSVLCRHTRLENGTRQSIASARAGFHFPRLERVVVLNLFHGERDCREMANDYRFHRVVLDPVDPFLRVDLWTIVL
jgi:hypothetical protein